MSIRFVLLAGPILMGCGMAQAQQVQSTRGTDIFVDDTWTFDEINAILDSDPGTLARSPYEATVAGDGDTIHFAAGQYDIPQIVNTMHFEVRVGGTGTDPDVDVVTITGAGMTQTIFSGPSPTSGRVFRVYRNHVVLSSFTTLGSKFGIEVDGLENADFQNIRFDNILTIDHEKHYSWPTQDAPGDGEPGGVTSVWGVNLYILGGGTGFNAMSGGPASQNTKGFGVSNSTVDGAQLGMSTPILAENQQVVDVIGQHDWFDILIIGTNAAWTPATYDGFASPEGVAESENGSDSLETLGIGIDFDQDGIPDFNTEFASPEAAGLDRNSDGLLVPTANSPLANLPPTDLGGGRTVWSKGYVGAMPPHAPEPIPTVSEWGGVIMALLLVTLGTGVFRSKSQVALREHEPCGR